MGHIAAAVPQILELGFQLIEFPLEIFSLFLLAIEFFAEFRDRIFEECKLSFKVDLCLVGGFHSYLR